MFHSRFFTFLQQFSLMFHCPRNNKDYRGFFEGKLSILISFFAIPLIDPSFIVYCLSVSVKAISRSKKELDKKNLCRSKKVDPTTAFPHFPETKLRPETYSRLIWILPAYTVYRAKKKEENR